MSITAAKGFRAAGIAAGLKASGALDLAIVLCDGPDDIAAAVTTPNRFAAAPVLQVREAVADGKARAVVLNSGCANACTGEQGVQNAQQMAELVAAEIDAVRGDVLVCSTGLIGSQLPMDNLREAIPRAIAAASERGGADAARAIMTTDTVAKEATKTGAGYTVGGMTKGAGMLNPAMATMLSVITTDAKISAEVARNALRAAVATTFNRADSDGCQSTNDTVILLASGAAEVAPSEQDFTAALEAVCHDLVLQMLADAEGASHTIAVTVTGAISEAAAERAARTVTSSNLLKAAIYGNDPNWGRILAALGTLDAATCPFDTANVLVAMNGTDIFVRGAGTPQAASVDLTDHWVAIDIDLAAGNAAATVYTNDLTHDYVTENSAYST